MIKFELMKKKNAILAMEPVFLAVIGNGQKNVGVVVVVAFLTNIGQGLKGIK